MATDRLPRTLRARTDAEDVQADVEAVRGTTMDQRVRILVALCRLAAEQIAQHPDPRRALDHQDQVPEQSRLLMERLRGRRG